jgi:hypothetical protein
MVNIFLDHILAVTTSRPLLGFTSSPSVHHGALSGASGQERALRPVRHRAPSDASL